MLQLTTNSLLTIALPTLLLSTLGLSSRSKVAPSAQLWSPPVSPQIPPPLFGPLDAATVRDPADNDRLAKWLPTCNGGLLPRHEPDGTANYAYLGQDGWEFVEQVLRPTRFRTLTRFCTDRRLINCECVRNYETRQVRLICMGSVHWQHSNAWHHCHSNCHC